MRVRANVLFAFLLSLGTACHAKSSIDTVIAANKHATEPAGAFNGEVVQLHYSVKGQGSDASFVLFANLKTGQWKTIERRDGFEATTGYDGARVWQRERSGLVSVQDGGDVLPLATNQAFRLANRWWESDFAGATIEATPADKNDSGSDVSTLTVTPQGGVPFKATFNADHLLSRVSESVVTHTTTTTYVSYRNVAGRLFPVDYTIDDGAGPANLKRAHLEDARITNAVSPREWQMPKQAIRDGRVLSKDGRTVVPIKLLNNKIYAIARINGKAFQLLVDTGAFDTLVPNAAQSLDLHPKGASLVTGGGAGSTSAGIVSVSTIRVGDALIKNQPMDVMAFSGGKDGVVEDWILGYEFLSRFVSQFDVSALTWTLWEPDRFPGTNDTSVPFRLFHQLPEVDGSYNGTGSKFIIDTGARMPLYLGRVPDGIAAGGIEHGSKALVGWGVGGPAYGDLLRGPDLMLGDVDVSAPLTIIANRPNPMNIVGMALLKRFVLTMDYRRRLFSFHRLSPPPADLDTFDRLGAWLNQEQDGFEVAFVTDGTPASEAGLKAGDLIVAIDGQPASTLSLPGIRQRFRTDAVGTTVQLTIRKDGVSKQHTARLRNLLSQ
jgi:Aspartyl protease/PDZ domain